MNVSKQTIFNILIVLATVFIVFASTVPIFDSYQFDILNRQRYITLFDYIEQYLLVILS